MNQTNVQQAHLNGSGFLVLGRNRIKGISFTGSATAGFLSLFDTTTAPITTATYGRSGTTITVTQTAHGFVTGQSIGIDFAAGTGGTATNGNYIVTVTNSSTFTVTDINSGSITAGAAMVFSTGRWLLSYDVAASDNFNNSPVIADDGVLAVNGIYAYLSNVVACNIYYG
jgi:myosin-crossreactive antigen